jgi:predicted nucleotidyltransferase
MLFFYSDLSKTHYICVVNLKDSIRNQLFDFLSLCKTHNVKNLYAFGSSVTDKFNEDSSDIDLLIEIDNQDPIERGENLMSIWDKFEQFFQRKVDLLTYNSIKNPILKKKIDSTKVLIYDGIEQKISF